MGRHKRSAEYADSFPAARNFKPEDFYGRSFQIRKPEAVY